MTNISAYAETVATHYWGQPTARRGHELRWGTHGSKSLDLKKGTWFDHENNEGGGVIDLVRKMEGAGLASIPDVLERRFGLAKQTQKALQPARYLAKCYDYYNADGELAYQVQRFEPKTFRQRQPDGKGGWINNMNGVEALPYNLPAIMLNPNKTIFIVEGEKCADKLATLGAIATTSHGGAGNWKESVNQYFTGRKVVILPDADAAGDKHAKVVIANLMGVASEIRRVDLPGLTDKQDVYDWFDNGGSVEALRALVKGAEILTTAEVPDPVSEAENAGNDVFLTFDEQYLMSMPPVEWMVEGLLTRHGFAVMYGAPGTGKSFLAIDVAMSLAHGRDWQGRDTKQGAVLYIAGEGVGGLGKRVKAWRLHNKIDGAGELIVLPTAVNFREQEQVEKLMRTIDALGKSFSCVVVDTVARALLGGEENSATDMGLFVAACDAIKAHCGCGLLAIHHANKTASGGINSMRGSSALAGAADTVIAVSKQETLVTVTMDKQKDAEPIEKMVFEMVSVALPGDTSIIMKETDQSPSGGGHRLSPRQEVALRSLKNLMADRGQPTVRKDDWVDRHKVDASDLPSPRRADARQALVDKRIVCEEGGNVWITMS